MSSQPQWSEFFDRVIDGYLLLDLEAMDRISMEGYGNCGYPMLLTIFSGADLLGGLSSPKWSDDPRKQKKYFKHFLKEYMGYGDENLIQELRESVRNRLAHSFLTDNHVMVYKKQLSQAIERRDNLLNIDASKLFQEFKTAVSRLKAELNEDQALSRIFENNLISMQETYVRNNIKIQFNEPIDVSLSAMLMPPSGTGRTSGASHGFQLKKPLQVIRTDNKKGRGRK
ncbi:MAG TPA: hypothetical protein VFT49_02080 [Candidatus Saccharimonadales bacterium]|nr:hypothetical protein [Candidatus Saccharimonadales bacterium]